VIYLDNNATTPIHPEVAAAIEPYLRGCYGNPSSGHAPGHDAAAAVATAAWPFMKLGREFMPPLHEGTILYMPTTLPGIGVREAQQLMTTQDRVLASFSGRLDRGRRG